MDRLCISLTCLCFVLGILFSAFASAADAQTPRLEFPEKTEPHLNDLAGLLDDQAAEQLTLQLNRIRQDYGVELVVVTLRRRADWGAHDSLETFAAGLFEDWGIGASAAGAGVFFLTLVDDREVRIELGTAFPSGWSTVARQVLDEDILPIFAEERFADGLRAGTNAVQTRIIAPFHAGDAPPANWGGGLFAVGWFGLILLIWLWGHIKDHLVRFTACPGCGTRGTLRRSRETTKQATSAAPEKQMLRTSCTACNYRSHTALYLPPLDSGSESGGGSGGGGGASGRF